MKNLFRKPYSWAAIFTTLLIAATVFVILDTFVIPKPMKTVQVSSEAGKDKLPHKDAVISDKSYQDKNINIKIESIRKNDTTLHIADIQIKDASYLKTALANNTFGRNITQKTSEIMKANNGIFAVNGDYYGFRDLGYVMRNGEIFRDTPREAGDDEALMIDKAGNFSIIEESKVSLESLKDKNLQQIFSFGPALIRDGKFAVNPKSEVAFRPAFVKDGKVPPDLMKKIPKIGMSNPRAAIGQIAPLHYIVIVSDGRVKGEAGLSLYQLAEAFYERGCTFAYNLDGGGSSTMYFNGKIINNPTDGRLAGERGVSDIVYIGY